MVGLLIVTLISGFEGLLLETVKSTCKHRVFDAVADVTVLFFLRVEQLGRFCSSEVKHVDCHQYVIHYGIEKGDLLGCSLHCF
jgi:hypothetical protein